jgi:thiamine biosynthesis protein ThiS
MSQLRVVVNGEDRRIVAPASLLDLLGQLGLDPRTVVVELNREIVRRPRLAETPVADGDTIELVHFVGGG